MEGRTEAKELVRGGWEGADGTGGALGRYGIACGRWNDERGRCGTMRSELETTVQWDVDAGRSQLLLEMRYTRRSQDHVPTRKEKVSMSQGREARNSGAEGAGREKGDPPVRMIRRKTIVAKDEEDDGLGE